MVSRQAVQEGGTTSVSPARQFDTRTHAGDRTGSTRLDEAHSGRCHEEPGSVFGRNGLSAESCVPGDHGGMGAIARLKLSAHLLDVQFYGRLTQAKHAGDFLV